jgi:hypothetical protein
MCGDKNLGEAASVALVAAPRKEKRGFHITLVPIPGNQGGAVPSLRDSPHFSVHSPGTHVPGYELPSLRDYGSFLGRAFPGLKSLRLRSGQALGYSRPPLRGFGAARPHRAI